MSGISAKCKRCLWGDQCPASKACDHYTPIGDAEDEELVRDMERARPEYRRAWNAYMDDRGLYEQ